MPAGPPPSTTTSNAPNSGRRGRVRRREPGLIVGHGGLRAQSRVMLCFWMTGFQRATSAASTLRNSAGEFATGSMYWQSQLVLDGGLGQDLRESRRAARLTIAGGVFAGTMKPIHASAWTSCKPASASVGSSGSEGRALGRSHRQAPDLARLDVRHHRRGGQQAPCQLRRTCTAVTAAPEPPYGT